MFKISDTCKRLIVANALCTVVLAVIGIVVILMGYYDDSAAAFIMGIVLACLFTTFKLFLMERAINKSVDMSPEDSKNYMRMQYMNRYFLSAVAVIVAIFANMSLLGVVLGLFALTPAVFIAGKMENAAKENKIRN